eukprot:3821160-Lingulodinium_polyedra.AAC.1
MPPIPHGQSVRLVEVPWSGLTIINFITGEQMIMPQETTLFFDQNGWGQVSIPQDDGTRTTRYLKEMLSQHAMQVAAGIYIHNKSDGSTAWIAAEQRSFEAKYPLLPFGGSEVALKAVIMKKMNEGMKTLWELRTFQEPMTHDASVTSLSVIWDKS